MMIGTHVVDGSGDGDDTVTPTVFLWPRWSMTVIVADPFATDVTVKRAFEDGVTCTLALLLDAEKLPVNTGSDARNVCVSPKAFMNVSTEGVTVIGPAMTVAFTGGDIMLPFVSLTPIVVVPLPTPVTVNVVVVPGPFALLALGATVTTDVLKPVGVRTPL